MTCCGASVNGWALAFGLAGKSDSYGNGLSIYVNQPKKARIKMNKFIFQSFIIAHIFFLILASLHLVFSVPKYLQFDTCGGLTNQRISICDGIMISLALNRKVLFLQSRQLSEMPKLRRRYAR